MQFSPADIAAMLAADAMGTAVTLSTGSYSSTISAKVSLHDERIDPLLTGRAGQWYVITMSDADAAQLTTDWTVVVAGERREVLETVPKGNGLTDVYLGDIQGADEW